MANGFLIRFLCTQNVKMSLFSYKSQGLRSPRMFVFAGQDSSCACAIMSFSFVFVFFFVMCGKNCASQRYSDICKTLLNPLWHRKSFYLVIIDQGNTPCAFDNGQCSSDDLITTEPP